MLCMELESGLALLHVHLLLFWPALMEFLTQSQENAAERVILYKGFYLQQERRVIAVIFKRAY